MTHKNKAADAIPNQKSVHSSSSGALKGKEGCWGWGGFDVAKACSRSAKKHTAWRSCDAQKQSGQRDFDPKFGS